MPSGLLRRNPDNTWATTLVSPACAPTSPTPGTSRPPQRTRRGVMLNSHVGSQPLQERRTAAPIWECRSRRSCPASPTLPTTSCRQTNPPETGPLKDEPSAPAERRAWPVQWLSERTLYSRRLSCHSLTKKSPNGDGTTEECAHCMHAMRYVWLTRGTVRMDAFSACQYERIADLKSSVSTGGRVSCIARA
eukprot:scaffold1466_cov385-Prasinococcus_capsulatus_cf.AAC.6